MSLTAKQKENLLIIVEQLELDKKMCAAYNKRFHKLLEISCTIDVTIKVPVKFVWIGERNCTSVIDGSYLLVDKVEKSKAFKAAQAKRNEEIVKFCNESEDWIRQTAARLNIKLDPRRVMLTEIWNRVILNVCDTKVAPE